MVSMEKEKTTPLGKSEGAEPERFIPDGMGMFQRNVKRMGDCALAFLALIVFSPLFLLCYIAVKREDGGPAIFRQERIGRFGRPFNIYKFRSMRLDAEKFGPALYKGGADPRMTRVGKFLRVHHLDELPQLWNVFVGDIGLSVPRPERKFCRPDQQGGVHRPDPWSGLIATLCNGYTDTDPSGVTCSIWSIALGYNDIGYTDTVDFKMPAACFVCTII